METARRERYYAKHGDEIRARANAKKHERASYYREYRARPEVKARSKADQEKWYAADPERELRVLAKGLLRKRMGCSSTLLPPALVEVEMERLRLGRAIRKAKNGADT